MPPYGGHDAAGGQGFAASKGRLFRVKLGQEQKRLALIQRQSEEAIRREREDVQREFIRLQVRTPRCRLTSPVPVLTVSAAWLPPPDSLPTFSTPEGDTISVLPTDSPYVAALLKRRSQARQGCTPSSTARAGGRGGVRGGKGWTARARVVTQLKNGRGEGEGDESGSEVLSDDDSCSDEDWDGAERRAGANGAGGERAHSGQLPEIRSRMGNVSRNCDDAVSFPATPSHSAELDSLNRKEVMHRLETLLSPGYVRPKEKDEPPLTRPCTSLSPESRAKSVRPGMEMPHVSTPVIVVSGNKAVTLNSKRLKLPHEVTLNTGDSHRMQRATQIDAVLNRIASSRQDRFTSRFRDYRPRVLDCRNQLVKARPWTSEGAKPKHGQQHQQQGRKLSQRAVWYLGKHVILKEIKTA